MSFPAKLLDEVEHVVVSTRSHPTALIGPAALVAEEGRTIPLNRTTGVDLEIGVVDGT